MNPTDFRRLQRLAKAEGVQVSYETMAGQERIASAESLQGVLSALGVETGSQQAVTDALAQTRRARWGETLPPVAIAWEGEPASVPVRLQSSWGTKQVRTYLRVENGEERALSDAGPGTKRRQTEAVDGVEWTERQILLPALENGYHRLRVETPSGHNEALIIAAPTRSYSAPGLPRRWGVFLPMYALHSRRSWGAGNLRDWRELSDWTAELGGNIVASLPVLAALMGQPVCEPSPYSPASRLFWNEFYLDIEGIPEFTHSAPARRLVRSPEFRRQLAAFRRDPLIDYASQMTVRRRVLQLLARRFFASDSPRRKEFTAYLKERPEVREYAQFRAACEQSGSSWHTWPGRAQAGTLRPDDYNESVVQYHLYVQWIAQEQMSAAVRHCRERGVQFYLDLPLGVHPDGYDVWRHRAAFAHRASAGAPPDPFFSKGQDWGFAPLHPRRMREQRYEYVLNYLRFQMRHTGLLRIDHVMGLHRLYWVPHGMSPKEGAYVAYPAEELYGILSLESHRHQTALVGENLGTVPPQVNAGMKRHRLRTMSVVQYEQQPDPRQALRPPPKDCVASVNTHDMPTFASHWRGLDIADRADLGLIPNGTVGREKEQRQKLNAALLAFLRKQHCLKGNRGTAAEAWQACVRWLGQSAAEVVLLNLEDLWLEEAPQNAPGTYRERPNWRRKARLSLEAIRNDPQLRRFLEELNRLRADG